MLKRIIEYIIHPSYILQKLDYLRIITLKDETAIKIFYKKNMGKTLNLNNPKTFNEKIQWLKLYDRKDIYTTMVDKIEVKKYVENIIGKEYIISTLGIYEKFDDIDFNKLPNQFVLKTNHYGGSTGVFVIKNKKNFNKENARKTINEIMKKNLYYYGREWPYKNVKPRILIEKYMKDNKTKELRDYKFFCFNGKPQIMYVSEGLENHSTAKMSFFDMKFNLLDCKRKDFKLFDHNIKKPKNFEKMKEFASILSKEIPHLRVDFYEINNKLFFGELTFSTCSGLIPFENEEWDKKLGDMLDISRVKKNEK